MKLRNIDIDKSKLYSKDALIQLLNEDGGSYSGLYKIREYYQETFGNELVWHYPLSDGLHAGVMIVTVKEGFISLPYNRMDETEYEIYELDRASMFNEDALQCFIQDWMNFSDELLNALNDMLKITQSK